MVDQVDHPRWPRQSPLTAKQVRFDDQTGLSASECGFAHCLDLLANFPHDLHHENDVSGRPQRAVELKPESSGGCLTVQDRPPLGLPDAPVG